MSTVYCKVYFQSYGVQSVSTFYHTSLSTNFNSCITKILAVPIFLPYSINFHPPTLFRSPKIVADSGLMLIYLNIYTSEEAIFSMTSPQMKSFNALCCTLQFPELWAEQFPLACNISLWYSVWVFVGFLEDLKGNEEQLWFYLTHYNWYIYFIALRVWGPNEDLGLSILLSLSWVKTDIQIVDKCSLIKYTEVISVVELPDRHIILLWPLAQPLSDWWCQLWTLGRLMPLALQIFGYCLLLLSNTLLLNSNHTPSSQISPSRIKAVFANVDLHPVVSHICLDNLCTVAVRNMLCALKR